MTYEEGILREQQIYKEEIIKFDKLAQLGHILDLPIICPKWNMKVLRPDGSIRVERESFNHSWTRNAYNIHTQISLFGSTGGVNTYADGGISYKTKSGGIGLVWQNVVGLETYGYNGAEGQVTQGIILGTGTTAEALNDYKIETLIDDGDVSGEMEYGFTTKILDAWDSGNSRWESQWERWFDNMSGGTITVNEFACYHNTLGSGGELCMIRDIISPGQDVAHEERLVLNQEFRVGIP